jgi:uncharacterized membrane protein
MKKISHTDFPRIAAGILLCIALVTASACTRQPVYPAPAVSGIDVVLDLSTLEPEIPQFFTYQHKGKNVSFFVMLLDGKVLSFLDACATCYRHKQGYRYEEGFVTCRYCNMNFSLHKLEKGLGGCYPIKIEGTAAAGQYRIPIALLEKSAHLF